MSHSKRQIFEPPKSGYFNRLICSHCLQLPDCGYTRESHPHHDLPWIHVATRPKALSNKISCLSPYIPGYRYGTLPFDKTNHLAYRIFGRNHNTHMYVINTEMTFDYPAFALTRQFVKHISQIIPYFPYKTLRRYLVIQTT